LGAAFQTSRSTGGTFLKAAKRSRQTVFCAEEETIGYNAASDGPRTTKTLSSPQQPENSGPYAGRSNQAAGFAGKVSLQIIQNAAISGQKVTCNTR
jgi:hypothetical protein